MLFTERFSSLAGNLSGYLKKASQGGEIKFNPIVKSDFEELASSLGEVASKIKELKDKEKKAGQETAKEILSDIFKEGVAYFKEGKFPEAISLYLIITKLNPGSFASLFNLGIAYAKIKDYENSIITLEKARSLNPNHDQVSQYIEKIKRIQDINGRTAA